MQKLIIYILLAVVFFTGMLSLYRASQKLSNMHIIYDQVVTKRITDFGRDHYGVVFKLKNKADRIAINLGTWSEAKEDSTINRIDTSKIYKFFLDPTVPRLYGINTSIQRIELNNDVIFQASNKLNLYGGAAISVLGLMAFIVVYKRNKKNSPGTN